MIIGQAPEWIHNPVSEILLSEQIEWRYNPKLTGTGPGICNLDNREDSFQFTYMLFDNTGYKATLADYILGDLWDYIINAHPEVFKNLNQVSRVKSNLLTKSTNNNPHPAHVDTDDNHLVIIYYANDSDGDTTIYNETFDTKFDKLTVKKTISPKKGKYVIFNGEHYHASSSPLRHDVRIVLNFNALINTI